MICNFLVGALVCIAGTLPFGPINLTVAKITIEKGRLGGFEASVAAAAVEILQVSLAVWFGVVIGAFLEGNVIFRAAVATAFLLIGVVVFRRRPAESLAADGHSFGSEFKTGLLVAAVNPQAIPFWIVALAAINDYTEFTFQGRELALFLVGVFTGKVLALTGFIIASDYLKTHLQQSGKLVNYALGSVLIIIGVLQWQRLLSNV